MRLKRALHHNLPLSLHHNLLLSLHHNLPLSLHHNLPLSLHHNLPLSLHHNLPLSLHHNLPLSLQPRKVVRTGPSMSSSNESSSDSGSSTDDSSDSDSSTSGDEKDEDVEEKEEESDVLEKKEEPEEKWNLKNFMVARPSPPVPAFSGNLPSMDSGHMKPGADVDVADMKVSPRKMADIGPCTSMPFMPHEDLDSILRGSEKASPDAPSTASSTASTQLVGKMVQSKGQGHPDKQQVADKPTATTTPQENITSGPGRPVSVSGNRSATGTTPAKRKGSVRDESASTATPERKRKQRDVKMKGSRPALVRTSSSSDVDIESVTPDPRSSQAAAVITSADKVLESVSKQLFISPLSSPLSHTDHEQQISHSHTENDRLTDLKPASELPARNKPHHRKDKDHASSSERGRKQDSSWSAGAGIRVKLSSRKANSEGSSHIDNIMAEMKEEFKLPAMLSPTEPHKSPSALAKDGKMAETTVGSSSNHVPTSACGKPSIVVRIIPSKLRNGLRQSRRISRTTALKRESAASVPSVFSDNTSVSVEKGAVAAGSLSPVPGACNKPVVDQTASVSPARSSTSSPARLASSKHKKEWKDPEPSETVSVKKPKSGGQQPVKSASKTSAESSQNGVEHPEVVKKATKRTLERRSSNRSLSSSVKKPKPESQSVKHAAEAEVPEQNGLDTVLPFNTYTATRSPARPSPSPATNNTSAHPASDPLLPTEERLEQPDFYLLRAKELKHIADKAEKPAKLVPYIKSILYFIMWGYSMEKQNHNEPNRVFPLYSDTCQLLQYVSRIRGNLNAAGSSQDSELAGRDKKLSVLILRMQSLLNLKMFSLKKPEAMKFKKIIEHEYKSSSLKISAHAPSPHQNSWNKSSTGIPSPMSPTPSPTCSIGSVGSQGSCEQSSSKPANGSVSGNASAMSSPGTVTVPQRIHTVTQKYMAVTAHLVQSHDLWDQADCEAVTSKGFFSNLDNRCGPLSLHSSMLHLVVYVNSALKEMGCS
nr:hypothetical protein BaRGS_016814 [Batillaria attramentaria]